MTPELFWLLMTALLAASLWIPFIVGVNTMTPADGANPFHRPPDLNSMHAWIHRAHRAHLNLIEQAVPFAIAVLIAAHAEVSTAVTAWAAAGFFWLRVVHAAGMITGLAAMPVRPILFSAGWITILLIAWQVLVA